MHRWLLRPATGLVLVGVVLACDHRAAALIMGRNAETEAASLEKNGKFREAAVWRLFAARAYRELIIPFEVESVRGFTQSGQKHLAGICAARAESEYPPKVRLNRRMYEEDLAKAGGEKVRPDVEQQVSELMVRFAPIPTSVPSRLADVEEEEKKGNWHEAAQDRELAARVYVFITVPFFERESDAASSPETFRRLQREALKCLNLARQHFAAAADDYTRAADAWAKKASGDAGREAAFCRRKSAEMQQHVETVSALVAAKTEVQKNWPPTEKEPIPPTAN